MVADKRQSVELPDKHIARRFYAQYELKEYLGAGATCTVHRCIEKKSRHEFAVKILKVSGSDTSSDLEERTQQEIDILCKLRGSNLVVELHAVVQCPSFVFLILQLCREGDLYDHYKKDGRLSEADTRRIMRQLLEAVAFLRERGVVHRDIKPENILLSDDLKVKLTDFGFAAELGVNEPRLREVVGTPGFFAPELIKGLLRRNQPGYGHEVDVWGCGVVMFEMMSGSLPFRHSNKKQMLRLIMEGSFELKSPEWDGISETAKDLVRRLLTVDPRERITAHDALKHPFFYGNVWRAFQRACNTVETCASRVYNGLVKKA